MIPHVPILRDRGANVLNTLAIIEMRPTITRLMFNFDFERVPGFEDWNWQKIYLGSQKVPLPFKMYPSNVASTASSSAIFLSEAIVLRSPVRRSTVSIILIRNNLYLLLLYAVKTGFEPQLVDSCHDFCSKGPV